MSIRWAVTVAAVTTSGASKRSCSGSSREGTGPNPVDRGKCGWKWSVATERNGIPIGWEQAGANRNDCILLAATLDAVDARGLLGDIETLHLDRGYDNSIVRTPCTELGIDDLVAAKRRKPGKAKAAKKSVARNALVRRADQLVDGELRAALSQHRPLHPPPTRPDRPRHRPRDHRQTRQVG